MPDQKPPMTFYRILPRHIDIFCHHRESCYCVAKNWNENLIRLDRGKKRVWKAHTQGEEGLVATEFHLQKIFFPSSSSYSFARVKLSSKIRFFILPLSPHFNLVPSWLKTLEYYRRISPTHQGKSTRQIGKASGVTLSRGGEASRGRLANGKGL